MLYFFFSVTSKEADAVNKELEELRKFKAEVEAKQKAEQEKPDNVDVSGKFFSKNEEVVPEKDKSNSEKVWEEWLDKGIPRRND
jgi:hypothetical protein